MGKVAKRKQELLEVRDTCINCEAPLALDQRFCSNCGGKRMYNRITWRNLFEDFIDRFLNIENAFLKTFIALFKKPEDVIGGYMLGMRKKYLPAFSYFAIAVTVAGISAFIVKNWFIEEMIQAQTDLYSGEAAEIQKAFSSKWLRIVMDYQSVFYFSMIPILALLSRLVFWNYKKYNLVEHFVIYLYAYSHIAMVTTILGLLVIWNKTLYQLFGFVSLFIMIAYMTHVLRRLFELNTENTILKVCLFLLVLFSMFIFIMIIAIGIGIYVGASGALDDTEFMKTIKEQAEARKAIKDSISGDTIKNTVKIIKDSIH